MHISLLVVDFDGIKGSLVSYVSIVLSIGGVFVLVLGIEVIELLQS